jgi:hypothetical protein
MHYFSGDALEIRGMRADNHSFVAEDPAINISSSFYYYISNCIGYVGDMQCLSILFH